MREAWRLNCVELKDKLKDAGVTIFVFFIFTGVELPVYSLIEEKIKTAIKKFSATI